MRSIRFPNMFNTNNTNTISDFDATKQNLILLLHCEKGELFGDPYYGIRLKRYLFDQNNYILKDIIIDEIYTQLALFMPQLIVKRNDINLIADKAILYCKFKAVNQANFQTNMYNLVLYDDSEE